MPRIRRGQQGGYAYHIINRGNDRVTVFHKQQDYFGLRLLQTFQPFNPLHSVQNVKKPKLGQNFGSTKVEFWAHRQCDSHWLLEAKKRFGPCVVNL